MFLNPLISLVLLVTLFFLFINLLYRLLSIANACPEPNRASVNHFCLFCVDYFHYHCCTVGCFCSRLLRDFPFLFVGNNSLTVALTLFSKSKLLISYYILHLEIIYSFYPKFPFCCSLQFCSTNFSLLVLIAEKLVQTKYVSEPVSDPTPIISTCWACECNVGGTPPISSILLFTLGVLVPLL